MSVTEQELGSVPGKVSGRRAGDGPGMQAQPTHPIGPGVDLAELDRRFLGGAVGRRQVALHVRQRIAGDESPPHARLGQFDALQGYGVAAGCAHPLTDHFQGLVQEISALPGWRAALVWAEVQAGRLERARGEIDDLRRDDFAALPRDANFVPACTILGHVAGELDDAELAAAVEPQLRPSAGYWVVLGYGPATLGPVAFTLGLACQLTGQLDQAVEDFDVALELSSRMRARSYHAHTQVRLAQVLEQRGRPGDVARAGSLRRAGVRDAQALGMTRLLRDAGRVTPAFGALAE